MEFNSVKDFKDNFSQKYHGHAVPILKEKEKDRKNTLTLIYSIWIIAVIISAITCSVTKITEIMLLVCGGSVYAAWSLTKFLQKNFERKLKTEIMPDLMQSFGNFVWTQASVVDEPSIRETTLFSRFDYKVDDDNFFGTYKGINICINEAALRYETTDSKGKRHVHEEFRGALISLELPRKFKAHTVIRKRSFSNKKVYQEVKLEDPEFMKLYYVDGSDQVESRYLLTTAFMERFKNVQKTFGANSIQASFKGKDLLIALSTNKDLFSIGNLNKPLNDAKQFTKLLEEFISILSIVDELKLNQNIGL